MKIEDIMGSDGRTFGQMADDEFDGNLLAAMVAADWMVGELQQLALGSEAKQRWCDWCGLGQGKTKHLGGHESIHEERACRRERFPTTFVERRRDWAPTY